MWIVRLTLRRIYAQTALTFAAGQRVTAEYNIALARAQLLRALGRD